MSLHSAFKTNIEKENNGVEIQFPHAENSDGSIPTFIISRMGKTNKGYQKALEVASRPYRRQLETGTMKKSDSNRVFLEVFCNSVLKGWKHVRDEQDNEIPFSFEAAVALMQTLPDLYDSLVAEAQELANFREAGKEADLGN